jgi:hypothetical protein
MSPDYKALCAELVAALDPKVVGKDGYGPIAALLPRARAALAQPEPVAPTDEELITMWATTNYIDQPEGGLAYARAVLACYGTPANNTRGFI